MPDPYVDQQALLVIAIFVLKSLCYLLFIKQVLFHTLREICAKKFLTLTLKKEWIAIYLLQSFQWEMFKKPYKVLMLYRNEEKRKLRHWQATQEYIFNK